MAQPPEQVVDRDAMHQQVADTAAEPCAGQALRVGCSPPNSWGCAVM